MCRASPLALVVALAGCGWRYAEQVSRPDGPGPGGLGTSAPAHEPPPVNMAPTGDARLEAAHAAGARAASPEAMAGHAFRVRLVDASNDATQLVHCTSGKIIHFDRRDPAPGLPEALRAAGVPLGVWVLRVDPEGRRPELADASALEHIRRHHRLVSLGRASSDGTLLFRYDGLGASR